MDVKEKVQYGLWLWRSWQSGHLRHQRSADRIPTSGKFFEFNLCQLFVEKTKINKKEAGNGPFKKRKSVVLNFENNKTLQFRSKVCDHY